MMLTASTSEIFPTLHMSMFASVDFSGLKKEKWNQLNESSTWSCWLALVLLPWGCPGMSFWLQNPGLQGSVWGAGAGLEEPVPCTGETEVLWQFTFPCFFCFLNVIISKTKSEYNPHEPKCVFFLIWEQPGSFPLAGCSFPPQVLRSKAGMQSFTFSLQVLLIKEALYKKHFSSVLINQINKNKNFCQAICFCSYPSTGLK